MTFQEFLEKYQKVPVEEYNNYVLELIPTPVVSCRVSTYQQASYIRQCLDGILMQKTNFSFEIVIGEDGSSDGTREICIEYAKKYPGVIRLFLHKRENNIQINGKPSARFQSLYTIFQLRGKYQTICEGDDYWTDPFKLQKQVDVLNSNDQLGLVFTDYSILYQESNNFIEYAQGKKKSWLMSDKYTIYEKLLMDSFIGTLTVMFRSSLLDNKDIKAMVESKWVMGDRLLWLLLSRKTQFYYLDEVTAIYRRNVGSMSNNERDDTLFFMHSYQIRFYFIEKFGCSDTVKFIVERDYHKGLIERHFQYYRKNDFDRAFFNLKKMNSLNFKDYYFFAGSRNFFLHSIFSFLFKIFNKVIK